MWFVTGKSHHLAVIMADGRIAEDLAGVDPSMTSAPPVPVVDLLPTGGTTLYLVPTPSNTHAPWVRTITVPAL